MIAQKNNLTLLLVFSLITCTSGIELSAVNNRWETTHYIWNFGLITACDKGMNRDPKTYFSRDHSFDPQAYRQIHKGDTVWVKCKHVAAFCKQILPTLQVPIVLVIADGDESFPTDCGKNFDLSVLIDHSQIIHIFSQNYDCKQQCDKITHIPIGMDFHTIAYKGSNGGWGEKGSPREQELLLNAVLQNGKPTSQRKKGAYVDFHHSDSMHGEFQRYLQFGEDRKSIFQRLVPTGLIHHGPWLRRSQLWRKKIEYAFSISPHGNGLDCHRTWEDLILGCIVIVKTSPLDSLYEGLPVVIVNDWSEITKEQLDVWLTQYADAFTNPIYREKLTDVYWKSMIKQAAMPFKGNA